MEGFCRGCLIKYNEPMELLQYTEKNRRLFVYSTGLQVKRNDTFTFQLCKDCFLNMKQACKFKKLCRTSDKRFRNYLALKEVGDPVDFCTFLKNNDDTLTFRLPMTSGNSTPANQKCRDDDNESTCTSIRNFMTDILQGEEMPDTEARIIREVIEEEADLLDDSLDSHWLQDDMSIDTDFRLDISFSPFSTPRTVNNDRCYTPKDYAEQKEEQVNFETLNSEKQTKILKDFTDAFKTEQNVNEMIAFDEEKVSEIKKTESFKSVKELCPFGIDEIDCIGKSETNTLNSSQNLKELISNLGIDEIDSIYKSESNTAKCNQNMKKLCDYSFDGDGSIKKSDDNTNKNNQSLKEICDLSLNDFDDIAKSDNTGNTFKNDQNVKELCDFGIDEIDGIEKSESNLDLPSLDVLDKDKIHIPNFYTPNDVGSIQSNNDMSNSSINIEALLKDKSCTIDRNLKEALKNTDNKEFSLEDLLLSPPVFQGASAASTPTITNILFGEKLDIIDTNINQKIGQCLEPYDDVQGNIEIFEEFFQNDTKEFALEDIKRVNGDVKMADWKEPIALVDVKVENKENELKNIDMDIIYTGDNDQADNKTVSTSENKEIKHVSSTSHNDGFDLEKSYCNLCKKKFKNSRALCIHFTKIHNIKIVKPAIDRRIQNHKWKLCNNCGVKFRDVINFARHLKKCGKSPMIFECDRCHEEFKSQPTLDKHMATHAHTHVKLNKNTGKKYVCTICGAVIYRHGNYSLHMNRHMQNYKVMCEECGKKFYRQCDLRVHMRKHTGETPFSCKYCTKMFARKDVLTRHVKMHLGERLFHCDNCGLECIKKSDLILHIRKKSCIIRKVVQKGCKKNVDKPVKEQKVTVIYTTGDDAAIRKQLPFLETELSN